MVENKFVLSLTAEDQPCWTYGLPNSSLTRLQNGVVNRSRIGTLIVTLCCGICIPVFHEFQPSFDQSCHRASTPALSGRQVGGPMTPPAIRGGDSPSLNPSRGTTSGNRAWCTEHPDLLQEAREDRIAELLPVLRATRKRLGRCTHFHSRACRRPVVGLPKCRSFIRSTTSSTCDWLRCEYRSAIAVDL